MNVLLQIIILNLHNSEHYNFLFFSNQFYSLLYILNHFYVH